MIADSINQALDYLDGTDQKHASLSAQYHNLEIRISALDPDLDSVEYSNKLSRLHKLEKQYLELHNKRTTARLRIDLFLQQNGGQ